MRERWFGSAMAFRAWQRLFGLAAAFCRSGSGLEAEKLESGKSRKK